MSFKAGEPADKNAVLNELDNERLRRAVERVREAEVPEDALSRAMSRAAELSSVAAAVRRQPAVRKPPRRWLPAIGVAAGLIWVIAAINHNVRENTEEALNAARKNLVATSARQAGLGVHDYGEGELYGKPSDFGQVDADVYLPDIGGSSNTLALGEATDGLEYFRAPSETTKSIAFTDEPGGFVGESTTKTASSQKKIIRTCEVSLVVKVLADAEKQIGQLVQQHKGEMAGTQVSQAQGRQRMARWVIRVPADAVDGLLHDLSTLGISENRTVNSQDVTEEYIDLETRISSKKKLEQRILDLLEKRTGDIKDVLAVEEQLARIRAEVESMEGRKKYLDSVTAMATVTVTAREEVDYVPPEVRSFSNQVGHAWGDSFALMKGFGKSLVLVAVAVGPWIPLVGLFGIVVVSWWRRRRSRIAG